MEKFSPVLWVAPILLAAREYPRLAAGMLVVLLLRPVILDVLRKLLLPVAAAAGARLAATVRVRPRRHRPRVPRLKGPP